MNMKQKVRRAPKVSPGVKKKLEDYFYYIGAKRLASDFKTIADFIINDVKAEYSEGNDIAQSIICRYRRLVSDDAGQWINLH